MGCVVCLSCGKFFNLPLEVNAMKANFLNRIREPSTWAGLSMLGVLFGLPPGTIEGLGQIIGGIAALAAVFMSEKNDA